MSNIALSIVLFYSIFVAGLAYLGVGYFVKWAIHRNMIDTPNYRSSHKRPTPSGGGAVVVILSLVSLCLFLIIDSTYILDFVFPSNPQALASSSFKLPLLAYINGAILIAVVSWMDDNSPLPVRLRFSAHSLAAIMVLTALFLTGVASGISWSQIQILLFLALPAFVWLVGLTNAYNFMDGIDGIAGLQAVIVGIAWAFIGWYMNFPMVMILGGTIATSSIGFLKYNWSPAQVFMGDVCSAFLGFSFAAIPLIVAQFDPKLLLIGLVIMWPFIFDSALTIILRCLRGENIFLAHRSHLYQQLDIAGYAHSDIALVYGLLSAFGGIMIVTWYTDMTLIGIGLSIVLAALALLRWVNKYGMRKVVAPKETKAYPPLPAHAIVSE